MNMNPGKLRHRITIWGKTKSSNEQGKTVYIDTAIKTIWAEVVPQTGKLQRQQAETILTNVTHKIIARYHKEIDEAYQNEHNKKSMFIIFNKHRFDIKFILNPYFRNASLEFYVEEVI